VQPEAGHRLRIVIDRFGKHDALPHVPIQVVGECRAKATKLLIGATANHDGNDLNALVQDLALGKAAVQDAGRAALEFSQARPSSSI
jgi:hypothetical protein